MIAILEWFWAGVSGLGVFLSLTTLKVAWDDFSYLVANKLNGRRLIVARAHIRREAVRLVVQGLALSIGVWALRLPNPPGAAVSWVSFALIAMNLFVVLNTLGDRYDRNRLLRYWETVDLKHVTTRDESLENGS